MDCSPGTTPDRTGSVSASGSGDTTTTTIATVEDLHAHASSLHTSLDHPRKRLSFFGRSNSDASSTSRRAPSSSNAIMTPPQGRSDNVKPPPTTNTSTTADPSRSSTSLSQSRRKTADPLDSIRKSLFGFGTRKKANANDQVNPPRPGSSRRSSSRLSQSSDKTNTTLIPFATPTTKTKPAKESKSSKESIPSKEQEVSVPEFTSEEQYYSHRKKSSISRPFNFQHLTHTAKKHIPLLQTVDEKNLTAKFWSVNAYQKPKEDLKEIQADDLSRNITTQPSDASSIDRPCSSQATTEVAESLDETTFDETQETKFNPDAFETIHNVQTGPQVPVKPPKHYSSMTALNSSSGTDPEKLRHLIKERSMRDGNLPSTRLAATVSDVRVNLPMQSSILPMQSTILPIRPTVLPKAVSGPLETPAGQSHREKQPLPPVPAQAIRKVPSKNSMGTGGTLGQLFPAQRYARAGSAAGSITNSVTDSFVSKRSSKSVATVNSRTDVLVEPTWEDDIDFAFDQEAEASCDFDWENVPSPRAEKPAAPTTVPEQTPQDDSDSSGGEGGGVRVSEFFGDGPSMMTPSSLDNTNHKRGSSVGHRGFQAARTGTNDGVASPPLYLRIGSSASGNSFPLIKASLFDCEKSPYTEAEMNFPGYDHATRHFEYLSDPESSSLGSSQRRKSSSTNSYESSGRSLRTGGSDTTRWSSASTSSVPDLLQSKRMSRSSVRKSRRMSRPLESVTSADEDDDEVPAVNRLHPTRAQTEETLLMRRPSTSGDRTLLFSAGRTVQRGRSATPPSRVALAAGGRGTSRDKSAGEDDRTGWI